MPVVLESRETVYFAEGIGLVKSISAATVTGESQEDVLELQGYAIP